MAPKAGMACMVPPSDATRLRLGLTRPGNGHLWAALLRYAWHPGLRRPSVPTREKARYIAPLVVSLSNHASGE